MTKTRILFPLFPFVLSLFWESLRLIKVVATRALAPLRKITTREIEVFEYFQHTEKPWKFVVIEQLECGHSFTDYGWSFIDLIYAYNDRDTFESLNPAKARRRRCHPCRDLIAAKKPVQSVPLEAKAVTA